MKTRVIIVVVGIALAILIFPSGLLGSSLDALTLRQILRGSASLVIFFWTITFAINM